MSETRYRAFVAAWPTKRGGLYPVMDTMSRTAKDARRKSAEYWDDGWNGALRWGWCIILVTVVVPTPPHGEEG